MMIAFAIIGGALVGAATVLLWVVIELSKGFNR